MPPSEALFLLAAATLVQVICSIYLPWGLLIDLPLIATLYVGSNTEPAAGALWGSAFGLMRDVTSLVPYWGLNGLTKTLFGFLAALLSRRVVLESLVARVGAIGIVALADRTMLSWMLDLVDQPWPDGDLQSMLPAAALTGLVGGVFSHLYDAYKSPEKDFRRVD